MDKLQVGIGADFFRRSLNDYSNWQWAWVRELCQNSIDCGSKNISFEFSSSGGITTAICMNDGPPMSREVLLDKFFNIGGTTKLTEDGQVGGFGLAKIVICFAHQSYVIETGDWLVVGSGGQFELKKNDVFVNGTRTTVVMDGEFESQLMKYVLTFARFAQYSGVITLKTSVEVSRVLDCKLKKGSPRREFSFGTVYTNNSAPNQLVVRIGGIPMFYEYIGLDKCVVLELKGRSDEVLTSNRDGLTYPYSSQLKDFIRELAVDKRSALKSRPQTNYDHYIGTALHSEPVSGDSGVVEVLGDQLASDGVGYPAFQAQKSVARSVGQADAGGVDYGCGLERRPQLSPIGTNFIVKNATGLRIPKCYLPKAGWSVYSSQLAKTWGNIMLQLHRHFNLNGRVSVGFVFEEDVLAQYELSDRFGVVYYVAPAMVTHQKDSNSRSFKKAWKFDSAGRGALIATAAHELVHGMGYRYHDEDFAAKYTDVMGQLIRSSKQFNWCFR